MTSSPKASSNQARLMDKRYFSLAVTCFEAPIRVPMFLFRHPARPRAIAGLILASLFLSQTTRGGLPDIPFPQDSSVKTTMRPELKGGIFSKLSITKDYIVYGLSDKGVMRLFDNTLALDRSFRPLAGKPALDIAIGRGGNLYYLYDSVFLSNSDAGRPLGMVQPGRFQQLAVADDGSVFLAGGGGMGVFKNGKLHDLEAPAGTLIGPLYSHRNEFFFIMHDAVFRVASSKVNPIFAGQDLTSLAFRADQVIVGTKDGFLGIEARTGRRTFPLQTNLPFTHITCLLPTPTGLWAGTTKGLFFQNREGTNSYYASRRWLSENHVIDLQAGPGNDVFVLTRNGLDRIQYRPMTLAQKAGYYEAKIRQRHIRYGFCSELRLAIPGDPASAEMIDTDNDGSWSNYYMASQAFHFAANGNRQARTNAWETFAALERLESINGLGGFPSRTFERAGFKFSDPDRWPPSKDGLWEWKATTSSDEIAAHTFGCAVLYECAARLPQETQRIAVFFDKIMTHILRNNLTLQDRDGKPTLWGRWNPEYVNRYPHTIFDRRLNSAQIIASLQLAFKLTGKEIYRDKAKELFEHHGYLENILNPMRHIAPTKGFLHEGITMGDEWNHSDDLLAFVTYWVLHRTAFDDELKARYAEAIKDHFDIEKEERCPIWSMVYASTLKNPKDWGAEEALWTLRRFPLDLVSWRVENSERRDITRLAENFRGQQMADFLPPCERPVSRWNGHPFVLDGGDGGHTEFAGDEFLLPYWMGRYLRLLD